MTKLLSDNLFGDLTKLLDIFVDYMHWILTDLNQVTKILYLQLFPIYYYVCTTLPLISYKKRTSLLNLISNLIV